MASHDTLPKLLLRNATRWPARDAMREKSLGIWQTLTWAGYLDEVRRLALGLAALGFKRGDTLAVIGDNRPRLYGAMLAAQALGGVSLALYQDSIAKELAYVIDHADTRIVVAEDEEQVDKLYEIRAQIPRVERVIYDDPRGLTLRGDPWLLPFPEAQRMGDAFGERHPEHFSRELEAGSGEELAILCYTSGTTGLPKGVMLTHHNLIGGFQAVVDAEGWHERDEMVVYLPMAWIGDFAFSVVGSLCAGVTLSCIETPDTYRRDLREIGPTLFLGPPRQWENSCTAIKVRMEEADRLKRRLYETFLAVGYRIERLLQAGQPVPRKLRLARWLGEFLVFAPLRDLMGARRIRLAYSGGAPLGEDLMNFFRALGVNLKQIYALTESSAVCTVQPDGEANSETMGRPIPGVELKITGNNEIRMRGPMVFRGYFKNEEATRASMDAEGWLDTGDAGFVDRRGHLKVIDRARDVSRLANGTLFAPQFLENKLKFSPYIREAVVLGPEREYVTAMVNIDLESIENWAERKSLGYSGYQDLSQKPEVYRLVQEEIARINRTLAQDAELVGAQIRRFLILNKELDADDGEVTRTRKLRRNIINERYAAMIEALYRGCGRVETEVQVTYEDGRVGNFLSVAEVWDVDRAREEGALPASPAAAPPAGGSPSAQRSA
jgi:long-chain acyl-CoA synthetase